MNLRESIKRILNESVPPQVRRRQEEFDKIFTKQMWEKKHHKRLNESEDDKEKKIKKNLRAIRQLLDTINVEGLCKIWVEYNPEDGDYEIRSKTTIRYFDMADMTQELGYIEDTIISWGLRTYVFTPRYVENCEDDRGIEFLNESEVNEKKKIQKNLRSIRHLLDTIDVDGLCEMWVEYNIEDGDYEIRSKTTRKYLDMADMVQELRYIDDTIRSWKLKTFVYTPYYVENCEDEVEFLNESEDNEKKIQKNLRAIRQLLDTIDVEGLCEIWVEYNSEDGDYEIRSKITIRYFDMDNMVQELGYIEDTIRSWGMKTYVYTPWYVENCEDEVEFINESEESRQERKFTKLLNNIEEYLNSNSYNSVVRFMVDYDEVMDDVIVNIFIDAEHAVKLGGGINSVIKKTGKKIMEDLSVFPFDFKYHIHFERPQLNESERKTNSSLHRLLNMLFDGFDNIDYDWANYMCGMGECCDPYAIGFTLPNKDYDDYIFKLVDGEMYDDDGDYPKEFRYELPKPCFQLPDIKDPRFDTIVFYWGYAEEIEDYMGPERNWKSDLLEIINKQFGCEAKRIIII